MENAGKEAVQTKNYKADLIRFADGFEFRDTSLAEFGACRGIDLLIGMDIISRLDIRISRIGSNTVMAMTMADPFPEDAVFVPPREMPPMVSRDGVPTYIPDYDKWAGEKFKEELEMLKSTLSKEE